MLNKLMAILLSFFILLQLVDFGFEQMVKIKTLIEHAAYHNEVYGDSFIAFLKEHYAGETLHTADKHHEHEKLPFKGSHQSCHHTNTTYVFTTFNIQITISCTTTSNIFHYQESVSVFEPMDIFQPPKHA
ncbi:MAG: hypothetical protein CSA39_07110 [Flavobacteriales bacterium]|nr:MAG: hypothetical protein CSA39_07110 [Flavobacteriales bacterium]